MKCYILALVFCCFFACSPDRTAYYDLSQARELASPKIVYTAQDSGALRQLFVTDSLLLLVADGKDPFVLVNRHSGREILRFNDTGQYSRPSLLVNNRIVNADTPDITFYDAVRGKFLNLDPVRLQAEQGYRLSGADYPEKLEYSVNLNLAGRKIVGTGNGATNQGMFFVYDSAIGTKNWVEFYPDYGLGGSEKSGYVYHAKTAANNNWDSVICGMCWMDMLHVYTLSGIRQCSYSFSDEVNLLLDEDNIPLENSTVFFSSVFPTAGYCYLLRKGHALKGAENSREHLLQLDWEGNIVNVYALDGELVDFCIDEKQHKLFGLQHQGNENDDTYRVLEYSLPES